MNGRLNRPGVALKVIQSWFGHHVARSINWHDSVQGFVPGRSTATAAKLHLGAQWVASIDIRDFFPSVTKSHVRNALVSLGYPEMAVVTLCGLMTLNGRLPQGSPASPVLANLCFRETDDDLRNLATRHGVQYTRYADDIVFSGKTEMPPSLLPEACSLVASRGWVVATEKTTTSIFPSPRRVHGIIVDGPALRLPKRYRNRLRMMLHALRQGDLTEELKASYIGHLAYARSIERQTAPEV